MDKNPRSRFLSHARDRDAPTQRLNSFGVGMALPCSGSTLRVWGTSRFGTLHPPNRKTPAFRPGI